MVKRDATKTGKAPGSAGRHIRYLLTRAVVGLLVGLCFLGTFWYWAIGIAGILLPYILMDRVTQPPET